MVLNVFRCALAFALAGMMILLIVAAGFTQPAAGPPDAIKVPDVPRKAAEPAEQPQSRAAEIRKLLNQPTDKLKQGMDPGQTLRDVLEFLGRSHELTFRVDVNAFKQMGADNIEDKQLARGLPPSRDVNLRTLLQDLLNQMEPVQGTFVVTAKCISIVPASYPGTNSAIEPVCIEFNKRSLPEALAELADQTGATIVLDTKRGAANANTQITAVFQQSPLLTTIGLLADMAGLKAVMVASTYYVTTEENANKLIEQGMAIPANVPIPAAAGGA